MRNESSFQGWYEDEDGEYRVERREGDYYSVYVRSGDAYTHAAVVLASSYDNAIERYEKLAKEEAILSM